MADSVLYDQAAAILASVVASLDSPPSRQFVALGPDYAHDCSAVVVEMPQAYRSRLRKPGVSTDRPTPSSEGLAVRVAQYKVTIIFDCIPSAEVALGTMTPPDVASLNAAAARILTDAFDAWQGLRDALPSVLGSCQGAEVGDLVPHGPSGGVAWVSFPVLVEF